jgi:hypothetical protein
MFESLRKSDDNPASTLGPLIVSLVAMSVIPALVLSFAVLCAQFGMVRFLIRHLNQAAEHRN